MRQHTKHGCFFLDLLIILIILIIVVLSAVLIFSVRKGQAERAVYVQLQGKVVSITIPSADAEIDGVDVTNAVSEREIDFDYLDDVNPVISSWIYIPGTVVDYPVVQGLDNYVYLEVDAYGNASSAGSIFLDSSNAPDYSDYKNILYGHNKRDGSMFACLHKYTDADFASSHPTLYIYLDSGAVLEFELLSTLKADAYDENIYSPDVLDATALRSYLLEHSDAIYGDSCDTELLLLSTCISGNSRRVVVFQKTINSY